jgi:hypothetical protein
MFLYDYGFVITHTLHPSFSPCALHDLAAYITPNHCHFNVFYNETLLFSAGFEYSGNRSRYLFSIEPKHPKSAVLMHRMTLSVGELTNDEIAELVRQYLEVYTMRLEQFNSFKDR